MALRVVGKGDAFIPVGTTFIQMEQKLLVWMGELEHLRGGAGEKRVERDTVAGEIVAGETVDKCIALLWWELVRPPIPPPTYPPSRSIALTCNKQAYITSRLNDAQHSGTYLIHLLKYALAHLPHSWTLLYRVIERLKGVRQRLRLGCLSLEIADRFLEGQVCTLPRGLDWIVLRGLW